MASIVANGVSLTIEGLDNEEAKLRLLVETLKLLPVPHLRLLPNILVGNRPPRGGGGAAHAQMPGGPYIRLNISTFQSSWNRRGYHFTLLHEVGHIIDWAFGCMPTMRRRDAAGYQALLDHPHSGATQGPSEHYADGYADYMNLLGRRRMSRARVNAIANSEAFRTIPVLDLIDLPDNLRP